jgi:uncharacterized protein YukE
MATLDRIIQMQQENKSDTEIMTQLQNEGILPSEITNGLQQAQIKNAVSPPQQQAQPATPEGMQASIMPSQNEQPMTAIPAQPPIQIPGPEGYQEQTPTDPNQDYYAQTPQAYSDQYYYAPQSSLNTETISEIAEQVAAESLENYKSKVGDIASFKSQIQNKVNDIDDRLKRIENSIDKIQQAILGKIGEFGESSAMIHQDLDNLHGTMSKLMNPLIDNINEMKKVNAK